MHDFLRARLERLPELQITYCCRCSCGDDLLTGAGICDFANGTRRFDRYRCFNLTNRQLLLRSRKLPPRLWDEAVGVFKIE